MIVLDTNVLSEAMRPSPAAPVMDWWQRAQSRGFFITAVTAAELRVGVATMRPGRRARDLSDRIETMLAVGFGDRILPFEEAASSHFAEVVAIRRRLGRPVLAFDALVAAIARSHGATLATRNTRDFDGCGLDLVNPFDVQEPRRPTDPRGPSDLGASDDLTSADPVYPFSSPTVRSVRSFETSPWHPDSRLETLRRGVYPSRAAR